MKRSLKIASVAASASVSAELPQSIALKNGESVDTMPVFGEKNCRSILTATPTVEVFEAPPEIKVTVREELTY